MPKYGDCGLRPIKWSWAVILTALFEACPLNCLLEFTIGMCTGVPIVCPVAWSKSLMIWLHFGFHWHCRSLGLSQIWFPNPHVRTVLCLSSEFSTQLAFSSPSSTCRNSWTDFSPQRSITQALSMPKYQGHHSHNTVAAHECTRALISGDLLPDFQTWNHMCDLSSFWQLLLRLSATSPYPPSPIPPHTISYLLTLQRWDCLKWRKLNSL